MSCPDWHSLIAERDASGDDGPAYREALAHLEGCPRCREAAYDADPLLVFRRLPAPKAAVTDIEAMRQAVATLRRTSEMTGRASEMTGRASQAAQPSSEGPATLRRTARAWARLRWSAAAAALLVASLGLAPSVPRPSERPEQLAASPSLGLTVNSLEDLSLPNARVYELAEAELQVVMVVDPSLNL